jgi:hypothetical protein
LLKWFSLILLPLQLITLPLISTAIQLDVLQLMMPSGPEKEGQTGMQRLVDKVINEFQQNCELLQITALDGNGGKNGTSLFLAVRERFLIAAKALTPESIWFSCSCSAYFVAMRV